ncbi:MAG TPA: DoxX family protein [Vicinamibacterales bacterium]|nr:DoxX family protein [Vicinamibacterales bacterium]
MRPLFLLGRAIFGGYFLYNGINHFVNEEMMSQYAAAKGTAAPDAAVTTSGAMLVAGGLSVLAGLKPRHGLAAIIGFLIPVSLQMHRFWDEQDPQKRMAETINFTKNMALVGAALMMMQLEHPWPASVDEAQRDDEEMFIRLGNHEFRSLPA